ncbi:hypothetical protein G168_gp20 [Lactobacillus phage ATCC8014]|uniref:Uncharacterized protein n=1 Tax=Lactobacillus phage ATCC8014 TaxID=2892340 RepID=K4I1R2_9CAUD|nr:hypothetical protein G168_gp20 [Lactobacillus phage ATCC8014]AFU63027.1 hypothetical protein 8014-B1_0020 [Lactobacillus phage ATCC8014]
MTDGGVRNIERPCTCSTYNRVRLGCGRFHHGLF